METCVIIEVGTSFTRGMVIEPFENGTYKILAIAEDKTAGVKKGEIIGKAFFYLGEELIAETPLLAENEIETASENKGFWNNIKDIF